MRNRIFLSEIKMMFVLTIALCGMLGVPSESRAQFKKLKDSVKKAVTTTTDSSQNPADVLNDSGTPDRDAEAAITDAYVFYLSKVAGFEARFHNAAEVTKDARGFASKLDAALRSNPSYRTRKIAPIVRDDSTEMTAADLLDKLNRAGEIINQGQADLQTQNMSYFVQGDVDDWLHKTEKLEGNDGFVPMAKREYPLLFNRVQGEKELLAGYSKSNGGKPLPESMITPLHNQIDQLLAAMNRLAPTFAPEPGTGAVEPFVATLVKTGAADYIPGAAMLRAVWSPEQQGWLIDKNDLGVPVNRRRMGTALFRVSSQKFCVEQHFFYLENYAGGGRYQRGDDVQFADVRFAKCQ